MCLDINPCAFGHTGARGTTSGHTGADLLGGNPWRPGAPLGY